MKYLRKFENHEAYVAAESGLILPNVSLCVQENEVHYKPDTPSQILLKWQLPSQTQIYYYAGYVDSETSKLMMWSQVNNTVEIFWSADGQWKGGGGNPQWKTDFLNAAISAGYNVTSIEFIDSNLNIGDYLPNWADYIEV